MQTFAHQPFPESKQELISPPLIYQNKKMLVSSWCSKKGCFPIMPANETVASFFSTFEILSFFFHKLCHLIRPRLKGCQKTWICLWLVKNGDLPWSNP